MSLSEVALAALVACLAALLALRHMVASGFAGVPGDLGDGRLNALFLEHSWGWLVGAPGHERLWGLPAFFPAGDNALAFSDAMLSFGPLYWPWRALGLAPDTSYQMWLLAVVAASVLAAHLFLRFAIGAPRLAAALGAWLAACSASRLHQMSHPQLLPQFFLVAALGGALTWARSEAAWRRRLAACVAAAALVAQLYGGFYIGLFGGLALMAIAALALALPATRREVMERLRHDWAWLLAIAAAAALALAPWLLHYGAAHELVGGRRWEELVSMLPRPRSWLYVSSNAWAYHWTARSPFFRSLPWDFEHAVGLGFFTTVFTLWAVVAGRRDTAVRLAAGAALLLMAVTTVLPGGFTLWGWVVRLAPPLAAARAVARIGLLLPLAAAVILVAAADRARGRLARATLLLGLALAAAEQLGHLRLHNKAAQRRWVAEIVGRIEPEARAFVVTRKLRRPEATRLHVDAMWAASLSGVPTVNGHSGNMPPGWEAVRGARVKDAAQRVAFQAALGGWLASQGAAGESVQWIEVPLGYRRGG